MQRQAWGVVGALAPVLSLQVLPCSNGVDGVLYGRSFLIIDHRLAEGGRHHQSQCRRSQVPLGNGNCFDKLMIGGGSDSDGKDDPLALADKTSECPCDLIGVRFAGDSKRPFFRSCGVCCSWCCGVWLRCGGSSHSCFSFGDVELQC